jgi:hypothetical protein
MMRNVVGYAGTIEERFWRKVNKTETCWLWVGASDGGGYGMIGLDGKMAKAHRLSWIMSNGPIPEGQWVLHHCDTPACVRPDHLFLGDRQANMDDMVAKGRADRTKKIKQTAEERFWPRVNKTEGCWLWTGTRDGGGFGYFRSERQRIKAHRFSWILSFGPIQPGKVVIRNCSNILCVRPDHLFVGTQRENIAHATAKGRMSTTPKIWGEQHNFVKLKSAQALEIRAVAAQGVAPADIAAKFGVTQSNICYIVRRKTWKHLP